MIKAVIFDMDGVLIDSEPVWNKSRTVFYKRRNISDQPVDEAIRRGELRAGCTQKEAFELYMKVTDLKGDIDKMIKERINIQIGMYDKELELYPNVKNSLKNLHGKYILALASGSPKKIIKYVLKRFKLKRFFSKIVSCDKVGIGKPSPKVYEYVAKKLNIEPKKCVVIEDAKAGIESAKRAGMKCIAITTMHPKKELFEADIIIDDLAEISAELKKL